MKQFITIIFLLTISLNNCFAQNKNESFSVSKNNNTTTWTINDSEKIKLIINGDVQLADDDQNIKSISPGGSLVYSKNKQDLKVDADSKGNLTYKLNGTRISGSAAEQPVIADCVSRLIEYGVDAERRAKRIYSTSGFAELINQVGRLKSDYAKQIYLSITLKNEQLTNNEIAALLDQVNSQIQNSYYRSVVLSEIKSAYLSDDKIVDKYIQAMNELGSDYYIFTSLQKILKEPLAQPQFDKIISITANINSDYYQSEVLKSALNNKSISPQNLASVIHSVSDIKSDYYKTVILKQSINSVVKSDDVWELLLKQTSKISSDYYLSETLALIAKKIPANDELKKEVELTAKNIHSDFYYGKVMRALGKN